MGYLRGGSILRVNLSERKVTTEPVESYTDRFIGGKAINNKILFDSLSPSVGPFDAENLLLFGVGPLVGSPFPGACRMDIMSKSPVTGALGDAGIGGYFGAELKYAGYDNLIIEGKSDGPVYLHIQDDRVEFRDALPLWGRDTYETPEIIRQEINDPGAAVISIGPAGEKLVIYASIMSPSGNAAARTGLGAVMGSKNLKAIAVRGTKGIAIARPQEFLSACQELRQSITQGYWYPRLHTEGLTGTHDREMRFIYDILGTSWEGSESISELEFAEKYLHNRVGCFACPVACFDSYDIQGAGSGCMKCSPPGDLTWDLKNPDLMVFWKAFVKCQRYGLDARALSNILAWLMKLHEQGIITEADTDGIAMKWGSPEAIITMAEKISYRQGIGDLLADGLPAAAKKIGKQSEEYLLISKGSPSDMHITPLKTRALGASVSAIGEDAQVQPHLDFAAARKYIETSDETTFQEKIKKYKEMAEQAVGSREAPDPRTTEGKAALVRHDEERAGVCDITGICTWMTPFIGLTVNADDIAKLMTLGLGTTVTAEDLTQAAGRMQHVERAFSAKFGLTRDDDKVSKGYYKVIQRSEKENKDIGCSEAELERMKDDYYQLMGWDVQTGLPTRETLEKHDLIDVADQLGI
ncbi:MAG: aldehyde ferredoxin oxidoreductase family protein [Bacillota bacterium]